MKVIPFEKQEGDEVIDIDIDLCKKIEDAHYRYRSFAETEKNYLNDHRKDGDGSAVLTPVFREYHNQTIIALREYEDLKNVVTEEYDLYDCDWVLDFNKHQVRIS